MMSLKMTHFTLKLMPCTRYNDNTNNGAAKKQSPIGLKDQSGFSV